MMGQGCVVWLTGLSGAGKSTIAETLSLRLKDAGHSVEVLDGDVVRENLSQGLGFSREDRDTNIRRIGFVAQLLAKNGVMVIVAAISPYRATRNEVRAVVDEFVEVYVSCDLETLIERDPKGLYRRALTGEIQNFTGISDPYEEPIRPEVVVETDRELVAESVDKVIRVLSERGIVPPQSTRPLSSSRRQPSASRANGLARERIAAGNAVLRRLRGRLWGGRSSCSSAPTLREPQPDGSSKPWPTIVPHGGRLVDRLAAPEEIEQWELKARELPALTLDPFQMSDVEMIAIGGFSPLTGFMGSRDYAAVLTEMRLESGLVWPIPVVLGVSADEAKHLQPGHPIALHGHDGQFLAILHLEEKYRAQPEHEALSVYRTDDLAHPGVKALFQRGQILLAGPVTLVRRPPTDFAKYRLDPAETRRLFAEREWSRVVGFQTRNPVHRAHEYIQKAALETVDGLLLHPLVGETKGDDIPAGVRMRCYEALLEKYYPADRVILAINPASMRYAGPREAVFHALVRQNYGCTHFIVGRDHAGIGNYYGPFDAQYIFDEFQPGDIGITLLFFDHTFFCKACGGMASTKTCPHDSSRHVALSGTQVRNLLRDGKPIPSEFTRPEVATLLLEAMRWKSEATTT
jgi:ATP sulfurylase/adenylyl-sulfate kinase